MTLGDIVCFNLYILNMKRFLMLGKVNGRYLTSSERNNIKVEIQTMTIVVDLHLYGKDYGTKKRHYRERKND